MASDEQKKLANFIKSTHNQLRKESRLYGPMEAWERHLARTEVLKNYATTMRELATKHWNDEKPEDGGEIHCRNKWIKLQCCDYFFNGGRKKFNEREKEIKNKIIESGPSVDSIENLDSQNVPSNRSSSSRVKIKLLDVGSCYNPLETEEMFDVTAIDIAPSTEKVLQCDFLKVKLGTETILSSDKKSVERLKEASFDAVIFSLLLEYFPCPEQRFQCCKRAYNLLNQGGILLVVTPDSNHVGANADIIKSWRLVLSRLGFMRIVYEKLRHVHCLGFRKCVYAEVASRWSSMQKIPESDKLLSSENKIYIPQDFPASVEPHEPRENVRYNPEELVSIFNEMPCSSDMFE